MRPDCLPLEKPTPDAVDRVKRAISTARGINTARDTLIYSGNVIPAQAGIHRNQQTGFPPARERRIKQPFPSAESHARAGADILVTSAPYFAPPRDVAVSLTAA